MAAALLERNRFDGDHGSSCDRGGDSYRLFESRPFSGGGDDSLVVVVIIAASTAVASITAMVRSETRQ